MLRLMVLATAAVLAAGGVTLADMQAHIERMDQADVEKYDLEEALDAGDLAKAGPAAGRLVTLLDGERQYWERTGLADAVELAGRNRNSAAQVVVAAEARRLDEAKQAFVGMSESCVACHELHPETRVVVRR